MDGKINAGGSLQPHGSAGAGRIDVTRQGPAGAAGPESFANRAERRLAAVLRFIPVMVFSLDTSGLITSVSEAGVDMMVMSSAEVVGRSVFELVPDVRFRRQLQRALAGERVRGVHPGGPGQYFHTCLDPVFDLRGNVAEVLGVSLDVTEAWQDKMALRQMRHEQRRRIERGRLLDRVLRARGGERRRAAADDSIRELLGPMATARRPA